jgi:predicted DNA-binding protein
MSIYLQNSTMSTTIRVSRRDKEALESLQRRLGTKTMAETLRKAISMAEASDEGFQGDTNELREVLRLSRQWKSGRHDVSEQVDDELAKAIHEEDVPR